MTELKEALVKHYGRILLDHDIEKFIEKIDLVATAHIYAGNLGDNPLCVVNRCLEQQLEKLNRK